MKFCIVVSEKDLAGMNIRNRLIEKGFSKQGGRHVKDGNVLLTVGEDLPYSDPESLCKADIYIFASRHQSEGKASLTVHSPGNWGPAAMGGESFKLSPAPASFMKEALMHMSRKPVDGFEITVEQTHHGPLLRKPSFFIEIGSSIHEWTKKEPAEAIANAILHVISKCPRHKAAVLLGGGHYNMHATKIMLTTEYAIGHVCAKHELEHLDKDMLRQAMEKTMEHIELIAIDWKGLGKEKERIVKILANGKIKYEKAKIIASQASSLPQEP